MAEQITRDVLIDTMRRAYSTPADVMERARLGNQADALLVLLAAHDRQVAEREGAQALRDAADDLEAHGKLDAPVPTLLRLRADSLAPRPDAPDIDTDGVPWCTEHTTPLDAKPCPECPAAPGVSVSAEQVEELLRRTALLARQTPGATLDGSMALLRAATNVLMVVGKFNAAPLTDGGA